MKKAHQEILNEWKADVSEREDREEWDERFIHEISL